MLVWFMHGASVRQTGYADPLRSRIIDDFTNRGITIPEFYSGYWGDALGSTTEVWDYVSQDLEAFKWDYPQIDLDDVFHYRQRREQLITGFFHDIFQYLSSGHGKEIRRTVAKQFLNFLTDNPFEDELHIVVHSLSGVILWDLLFSQAYGDASDPAYYVRSAIHGLSDAGTNRKVTLRSITTLGCPLLIFKQLMSANDQTLKRFAIRYANNPLRWINIIHASDVFAYPLRSSLSLDDDALFFRDHYLGERNFFKKSLGDVTMALGLIADHSRYWRSARVSKLVLANLLGDYETLSTNSTVLEFGESD
jgi:hypothetical protein